MFKILDFGIAKIVSEMAGLDQDGLTRTGYIIGTTRYMAPEQITCKDIGPHTDVYAVGCLFYHMISGITPFYGEKRQKILRAILHAAPVSLRKLYNTDPRMVKIPVILDLVISKSLAKKSKDRFASALDFQKALTLHEQVDAKNVLQISFIAGQQLKNRLDTQWNAVIVGCCLFFVILFTYVLWILPKYRFEQNMELGREFFANKNYKEAYQTLERNTYYKETPELMLLMREVLFTAFISSFERQDFYNAHIYLNLLEPYLEKEAFILLMGFLKEQLTLSKLDIALEERDREELLKILKTPVPKNLDRFLSREERLEWLKRLQR